MSQAPATRLVTEAILDALEDIDIGDGDKLHVGDGEDPRSELPYAVLSDIPGGSVTGDMDNYMEDETRRLQISCMSNSRREAEAVRDLTRAKMTRTILNAALSAVSASRVIQSIDLDIAGTSRFDRGVTETRFMAYDQWLITTTPA